MKILLIGGTGLLSSEVLSLCTKRGYDTYVLNRGNNNRLIEKQVKVLIANFYDTKSIENAIGYMNYDIVVDFLSRRPEDIKRVFPLFKDKCKQYMFVSSACIYRRSKGDGIITESSPKPNINWSYNIDKYNCEQTLIQLSKVTKIYYTIVRPYITYDNTRIPFGIAPQYGYHWTIIGRILAGKPVFVWDKGETITTLTRVEDFAKGVVGLFGNKKAYDEDFHIVTKENHTWVEFLETLFLLLNKKTDITNIPTKDIISQLPEYRGILLGDRAIDTYFDNSKIISVVEGLDFNFSLKDGLEKTIEYYKKNNYLKGIDYSWDAKIDRLIVRQTSKKLSFKDYLGNANRKDKLTYFIYKNFPSKVANKMFSILHKLNLL